jgi:hypothetical protein
LTRAKLHCSRQICALRSRSPPVMLHRNEQNANRRLNRRLGVDAPQGKI